MRGSHADFGCPGTGVIIKPYRDSAGRIAAETKYHDTAGGGGCFQVISKGIYYGVPKFMRVRVCDADRTNCTEDAGTFSKYAGPVYRDWGLCQAVRSTMYDGHGGIIMDHWTYSTCD